MMANTKEMRRKWLVVAVLCLLGLSVVFAVDCSMERLNFCLDDLKMLKENHTMRFPTSERALDDTCKIFHNGVNCIRYYADDCWTDAHKDLFHSIAGGSINTMGELCKQGEYRKTYLKHAECLSKFRDMESEDGECGIFFSKLLRANAAAKDITMTPEERLRRVCCAYHNFNACYLSIVLKDCGQAAGDFVAEHTLKVAGESLTTNCAAYTFGSRNCSRFQVISVSGENIETVPYDIVPNTGDRFRSSIPYSFTTASPGSPKVAGHTSGFHGNKATMLSPQLLATFSCLLLSCTLFKKTLR